MKGFYDFLKGTDGAVFGYDIYFKGAPFKIKGSDSFAYPVYHGRSCGGNEYNIPDIPGQARLFGFYIPEKSLYITSSFRVDDFEDDGLSVLSFEEIQKDFSKRVVADVEAWMENEDVEASVPEEEDVHSLFENGIFDIDIHKEKQRFKGIVEEKMQKTDIDYFSYISGVMQEYENITADMITQAENFIQRKKANKKLINQLVQESQKMMVKSGGQDAGCRRREVLNLFQKLKEDGYKNCTAFFNFAGKEVSAKVSLCETYTWIKGVRKATEEFRKDNFMPISMSIYYANRDAYLPFIVRIEIRNKCYYETEPLDIPKENLLYNELLMSGNKLSMEYLEEKYPSADCSIPLTDGDEDIVLKYIRRYEATEDGLKYLLNHGADGRKAYEKMLSLKKAYSNKRFAISNTDWNIMRFHDFMILGDNKFVHE